jgi:DNA-binding MurR/RpiR family transcriptional regulator
LDDNRRSNRGPAGISHVLPEGILARLRAVRDKLAPVGQETIDYILANQHDVIRMSITELAETLQISEGSVVRVCKQIGMKGFADLKLALARELVEPVKFLHEDIEPTDDNVTVFQKVVSSDIQALTDTLKILDASTIDQAVKLILQARNVEFYGIGSAAPVAEDAYYRMLRIGINCKVVTDSHVQAVSAAMTNEETTVITISHTGSTHETLTATRLAKEAGAKVIVITNYGKSPIQAYADVTLYTTARETLFRTEPMSSRIAELAVIDALNTCVALARYDQALEMFTRSVDVLSSTKRF